MTHVNEIVGLVLDKVIDIAADLALRAEHDEYSYLPWNEKVSSSFICTSISESNIECEE